jgi:hypothetical protein
MLRFGVTGMREIYSRCARNRQFLRDMFVIRNVPGETPAASLDLTVRPVRRPTQALQQKWGPVPLENRDFLISMQPSVTAGHVKALVRLLCRGLPCTVDASAILAVNSGNHRVSGAISQRLCQLVPEWRVASRFLARYPLNPAAYSALGAVIGHFLSLSIPPEWVKARAAKILKDRKRSFGLSGEERDSFNGVFTTDSTMGYRVGLHTTVSSCPDAFIYFSSVTHYSVEKIVRTATS